MEPTSDLHVDNCASNIKRDKMHIRYITCSDPREFNDIHDIVKLGRLSPRVEIAVQAHPSKMSPNMPRYEWFCELIDMVQHDQYIDYITGRNRSNDLLHFAIHINNEWASQICEHGQIPTELHRILNTRYKGGYNMHPIVNRIQVNIPASAVEKASLVNISRMIGAYGDYQFIFQYNNKTADLIKKLHSVGTGWFSPLYDSSGGQGISPDAWRAPLFGSGTQGYSGGLSPENIADNLDKISAVVPLWRNVWIDAEGKLKTDNKFDVTRARQYVKNAEKWIKQQNQR